MRAAAHQLYCFAIEVGFGANVIEASLRDGLINVKLEKQTNKSFPMGP